MCRRVRVIRAATVWSINHSRLMQQLSWHHPTASNQPRTHINPTLHSQHPPVVRRRRCGVVYVWRHGADRRPDQTRVSRLDRRRRRDHPVQSACMRAPPSTNVSEPAVDSDGGRPEGRYRAVSTTRTIHRGSWTTCLADADETISISLWQWSGGLLSLRVPWALYTNDSTRETITKHHRLRTELFAAMMV